MKSNKPNKNTFICAYQDGWTKQVQIVIEDEAGSGYRIAGPKMNGSGVLLLRRKISTRDRREIGEYLSQGGGWREESLAQLCSDMSGTEIRLSELQTRYAEAIAERESLREALASCYALAQNRSVNSANRRRAIKRVVDGELGVRKGARRQRLERDGDGRF